jgi:LacI family transcriptional regulator
VHAVVRASSVKDVAARAGVSLGTVSNVLNRPDRVSPETRARVEQAMRDLGFVRNESARQLRAGRSRTLAYVLLDARNPFFTDVAEGVERAAEAAGLSLFLCNSDNRSSREHDYLAHLVEQRVQGILVTPVDAQSPALADVRRNGTPVVIVDRTRSDDTFCSVAVDDELGGRLAVEHLVEQGHTRVAFIGGPDTIGQVRDRLEGARKAWADAGLPPEQLVVVPTEALTVVEGRSAGERVMGLGRSRRPTAAFCANDLLALGLLQQLSTSGLSVPGDLAIVGYDDIEYASAAAVPLTSVRQPRQELGRRAAELVLDEAEDPDHVHQQVVFTPELVARRSTLG